jgi:hypothetical protein
MISHTECATVFICAPQSGQMRKSQFVAELRVEACAAADRIMGRDGHGAHHAMPVRQVHQADGKLLAASEMQRDVAAIVDIGAIERRGAQHGAEDFFRDAAGHRRHRRDEFVDGKRRHRRMHAARDDAFEHTARRIGRTAQFRQFLAEFVEHAGETLRGGFVRRANVCFSPPRFHDQIDRTVLQVQPAAVREPSDLRNPLHARCPGAGGDGI